MTDFITLRAALAAGPVAGPWNDAEYTDHDGPPSCDDIAVQASGQPGRLETLLTMDWAEAPPRVAGFTREQAMTTARYIAAADPQTIAALLAALDDARRDAERLRAAMQLVIDADADDTLGIEFGLLEAVKSAMKQHEKT